MSVTDMGEFLYDNIMDPTLLTNPDDPAELGSSFDEIYPFGIPEGDFADPPQANAPFDFDGFDFDQQLAQSIESDFAQPKTTQSSFPDPRYVSLPSQPQSQPDSVWRPIEEPVQQQLHYPDPELFSHAPTSAPAPYYPLQPYPSTNATLTQHNFRDITPVGQQFSSLDRSLFFHGNMAPPSTTAGLYTYEPIQPYQDNAAFNPEDLSLSDIPSDLLPTALGEGWDLPSSSSSSSSNNNNILQHPSTLYMQSSNSDTSDFDYYNNNSRSTASSSRPSRGAAARSARPPRILPDGSVKKGRPCAKPQTEERKRVNQRRMEGYYRRKNDRDNLEKARQQSRESYWRRKQRRIEAGEKVRSYNAGKKM